MVEFNDMVRTRIAPSPTGYAHVGTAYVCLLNYAFTKKNGGKLVLRLDDSDQKRHVEGAELAIYSGLEWLGFSWDEGSDKGGPFAPYRISEKLDVYKKYAKQLLDEGKAFEDEGAIRLKNPGEDVSWNDLIRGQVTFPGKEVTDYVILKSDGYPTYNFATVIDDHEMEITHVIRGEEHISNTPRQIATYKAFGWEAPEFAHFPTLRNADRKKLSKRRDPVDLRLYREQGYLPKALVNFLCLLGWSHPDGKEVFDIDEFVDKFSIERVRKSGPIFDTKKLDWLNGQYIQTLDDLELTKLVNQHTSFEVSEKVTSLIKTRINKLSEAESLLSLFNEEPQFAKETFEHEKSLSFVTSALKVLRQLEAWNLQSINDALTHEIQEKEYKVGDFYMAMRLSMSGKRVTPPINECMEILGQDTVVHRLEEAQKVLLELQSTEADTTPE